MKLAQTGKLAPANKPAKLIRDAIKDLIRQEATKAVVIQMGDWHEFTPMDPWDSTGPKMCQQCLAGCCISRRLGVDTTKTVTPWDFPWSVRNKLEALDSFRE